MYIYNVLQPDIVFCRETVSNGLPNASSRTCCFTNRTYIKPRSNSTTLSVDQKNSAHLHSVNIHEGRHQRDCLLSSFLISTKSRYQVRHVHDSKTQYLLWYVKDQDSYRETSETACQGIISIRLIIVIRIENQCS